MTNQIRNINQTVQEREITKTSPDVIVYLEGLPYLINPYVRDATTGKPYSIITFNDHVINFTAGYDIDSLIPTGSVSLSVPNHLKCMYQAPGGNNVIETMMPVQVFAKGYYPSARGNTVYHRVFKGLVSNVSHVDTGTSLEISMQLQGILRFFELMFIELKPALLSNSDYEKTFMVTTQGNMNPYDMLADTFCRGINFDSFQLSSIFQAKINASHDDMSDSIQAGYISKWQRILVGLSKDVRILGNTIGNSRGLPLINRKVKKIDSEGSQDPNLKAINHTSVGVAAITDPSQRVIAINKYLPDFVPDSIKLTEGRIVSRLERIRTITNLIGYEGYQDIDGMVIFKPPLYNLDITQLGAKTGTAEAHNPMDDITDATNPFIVHLSEIESESENEDQGAVRVTRMNVRTNLVPSLPFETDQSLLPVVSHTDLAKLAKFGLREEPSHPIPWLKPEDKSMAYAYAVSELNKANRGWRQYSFTIPMRPELRLGFPMYVPHKDMYGYIKNVTINYQVGGAATMQVTLDTVRKRPLFPSTHKIKTESGGQEEVTIYTTQPNLVMQWSLPGAAVPRPNDEAAQIPNITTPGTPVTLPESKEAPVFEEQLELIKYHRNQLGTSWQTKADTTVRSFRVQNDKLTEASKKELNKGRSRELTGDHFFSADNWAKNGIDITYFKRVLECQPYTDEKGYELVTPFPWGRWISLRQAFAETRQGVVTTGTQKANPQEAKVLEGADVFVFAGVGTFSPSNIDPSSTIIGTLANLQTQTLADSLENIRKLTSENSSFELVTPKKGEAGADGYVLASTPQPDEYLANDTAQKMQERLSAFMAGSPAPSGQTQLDLDIADTLNETRVQPESLIEKLFNKKSSE
jgi:hypothetical protein